MKKDDSRKYTNELLTMLEDGMVTADTVIIACLNQMSEADVKDMMECNGLTMLGDEGDDE
jgi:hypothetical protein